MRLGWLAIFLTIATSAWAGDEGPCGNLGPVREEMVLQAEAKELVSVDDAQPGQWLALEIKSGRRSRRVVAQAQELRFGEERIQYLLDPDGNVVFPGQLRIGDVHLLSRPDGTVLDFEGDRWPEQRPNWTDGPTDSWVKKVRDALCKGKAAMNGNPQWAELRSALDRAYDGLERRSIHPFRSCFLVFPSFRLAGSQIDYRRSHRHREDKDFWSENGSNFAQGALYMSTLHCVLSLTPISEGTRLGIVLAGNVAGNTWEEIHLPDFIAQRSLPWFGNGGQKVKTDLPDFFSGAIAGSLAYWGFQKGLTAGQKAFLLKCP